MQKTPLSQNPWAILMIGAFLGGGFVAALFAIVALSTTSNRPYYAGYYGSR